MSSTYFIHIYGFEQWSLLSYGSFLALLEHQT